jgi:KRAB domain-containing zinc finger protein
MQSPVCGEVLTGHSSLNVAITVQTEHNLREYGEYSEILYKYKEYRKAFSHHECFQKHVRNSQ